MPITPAVLEDALVADPRDRATHSAYADSLMESDDPAEQVRGEFIRVQVALEDEALPAEERQRLRQREQELSQAHQRVWLGELAPFLLDQQGWQRSPDLSSQVGYEFSFARGWLDTLHVAVLTGPFSRALAGAPQARLLRALLIDNIEWNEELEEFPEELPDLEEGGGCLYRLAQSPSLRNVTILRIGETVDPDFTERLWLRYRTYGYLHLVRQLPKLEELYLMARADNLSDLFRLPTLTHLRVLQLYHQHKYPLEVLAANPAFANLTTLLCHAAAYSGSASCLTLENLQAVCRSPHLKSLTHLRLRLTELNDEGCLEVVESGILKRLKVLDLNLGSITDEGASVLAECPDLKNLQLLDVGRNALTAQGIAALQATGVPLRAHGQHDEEGEWDEDVAHWTEMGDCE